MGLPDVGLGGHSREGGHRRGGHDEELAPPYRGHRVTLGPQPGGPQQGANDGATNGANDGGHELGLAEGANVGDDAGATIRVDVGPTDEGHDGRGHELPDADLEGERMSTGERLMVAFRYWMVEAKDSAAKVIKSPGGIYHTQPESLAQHDARVERKDWVPADYEGKWLGPVGVAYQQTFGKFGIATGYAWAWLLKTPIAFIPTLIFIFIAIIWIKFF